MALPAWGNRGNAVYTFTGGLLTIGLSGALAWLLEEPLVFPSLGATAFLFFETPMAEVALSTGITFLSTHSRKGSGSLCR